MIRPTWLALNQLLNMIPSHHPPVTAYCIWNDKHGVRVSLIISILMPFHYI